MYPYLQSCANLNLPKGFLRLDTFHLKRQLQKILTLTIKGIDTSQYFPEIVKHLTNNDLSIKKLVCWYITRSCMNSDNVLLIINSLVQCCNDPNPLVKCLAIKTLTSIQQNLILEYAIPVILKCLNDENLFVRRAAILGCAKLFRIDPSQFMQHRSVFIQQLQQLLKDSDSVVVYNTLNVLNEITMEHHYDDDDDVKNDDGDRAGNSFVVSKNLAIYLVSKLETFSNIHKPTVLSFILRYDFKNPQETLQFMNALDKYFKKDQHIPACVTSSVTAAFVSMVTNHLPHLKPQVLSRSSDCLLSHLNSGNNEIKWCLLRFLEDFVVTNSEIFNGRYKTFSCKSVEPGYLKVQKLKTLPHLVTTSNFYEILEDLISLYKNDTNIKVRTSIIKCISCISGNVEYRFRCLQYILNFLKMKPIIQETSIMLTELLKHDLYGEFKFKNFDGRYDGCRFNVNSTDEKNKHPEIFDKHIVKCSEKENEFISERKTDEKKNHELNYFQYDVLKVVLDSINRPGLLEEALIESILFLGNFGNVNSNMTMATSTDDIEIGVNSNLIDISTKSDNENTDGFDNEMKIIINDKHDDRVIDNDDDEMKVKKCFINSIHTDGIDKTLNAANNNTSDDDNDDDNDDNNKHDSTVTSNYHNEDLFAGIEHSESMTHKNIKKYINHQDEDDDHHYQPIKLDADKLLQSYKQLLVEIPYGLERFLTSLENSIDFECKNKLDSCKSIQSNNVNAENRGCLNILSALLTTFSKIFMLKPAVCQHMLGRTLELCGRMDEPNLKFKSYLYHYALENDFEKFKTFLSKLS